ETFAELSATLAPVCESVTVGAFDANGEQALTICTPAFRFDQIAPEVECVSVCPGSTTTMSCIPVRHRFRPALMVATRLPLMANRSSPSCRPVLRTYAATRPPGLMKVPCGLESDS